MKTLKHIFIHMVLLVIIVFTIGIVLGAFYTPVGESARQIVATSTSMTIVKSMSGDTFKFIMTIFFFNSIVAGILIMISGLKRISPYVKYIIYFELMYQMFAVSLLIGYATHIISIPLILASILPHGIIEVPVIILAAAYGVYLCQEVEEDIFTIIPKYIRWCVAPLLIAAIIEVLITPLVMSLI